MTGCGNVPMSKIMCMPTNIGDMLIVECCILAMDCELVLENSSSAVVYTLSNTTI